MERKAMAFKAITRIGDLEASHDGCPESRLVEGDHRITIFGQPVGRIGDHYEAHSSSQEDEHRDYIKEGINAVKAWGIPIATVDCLVSTDGHGEDTHVLTGENRCSVSTSWRRENGYENGFKANRDRIMAFGPDETDKTILCLPDICETEAGRAENWATAQGWMYLREMFVRWFAGRPLSNPKWSCSRRALVLNMLGTPLFDDDFASFRKRHTCGRDFIVTSDVYVFDDFQAEEFFYES